MTRTRSRSTRSFSVQAKDAHYKHHDAFTKSRPMIHHRTKTMFVTSFRGAGRDGYAPTKQTKPSLSKRRYSIDIVTSSHWNNGHSSDTGPSEPHLDFEPSEKDSEGADLSQVAHALPDPNRYWPLNKYLAVPPQDEDVYLEIGESSIFNSEVHRICDVVGDETWWCDNTLNTGLEFLSREYDCEANRITVLNSVTGQMLYMAGQIEDTESISHLAASLCNKDYIIVPINDGYVTSIGSHWSLAVIDRISKTVHYYDSLRVKDKEFLKLGFAIAKILLNLLGGYCGYTFCPEENSPNQVDHNQCKQDGGACGPFVHRMAEMLLNYIRWMQDTNSEAKNALFLNEDFPAVLGFDSLKVRKDLKAKIMLAKRKEIAERLTEEHDKEALMD